MFKDLEIIVVDSGSEDGTPEIAKRLGAKVVYEPKLGFAVAKNFGASEASGDILVFMDADSLCPPNWLDKVLARFQEKGVVCVLGPIKPLERRLLHQIVFDVTTNIIPRLTALFGFYVAQAPNQSFRRSAFEKVGGYDERLRMLEDNELPNRIKKVGKVVFDKSIYVYASARRYDKEGYIKATLRFLGAYWKIYFQKKAAADEYPLYR